MKLYVCSAQGLRAKPGLDPGKQPGREDDVDDLGDGREATPVALQFARQRHPADRLRPGLDDALKAAAMGFERSSPTASTTGYTS